MKTLLIYGIGNTYTELKKILKWEHIQLIAFLETNVHCKYFEGISVYPSSYVNSIEFDYIICASIYEYEMYENLKCLGVPKDKIVSGKMKLENILKYPDIFDISKFIAFQNEKILGDVRILISRNRFIDMSKGVTWLQDLSFTAGGMAVSYDYMYVMLRILIHKRPKSILEMGLGQSSKVLEKYQKYTNCDYDIVEQNKDWYDFFREELAISDRIKVHINPMKQVYNEEYRTRINCYTDFDNIVMDKRYDFISIDGPFGSGGLSRIDILSHIPQCLDTSFSIMLDDYARDGEKNMIKKSENSLQKNGIEYYKAIYGEDKEFVIITSKENSFMCSLY